MWCIPLEDFQQKDILYMEAALELAKKAAIQNEVPIGAIVVDAKGKIIGRGYNDREETQSATRHAEIIAINEATEKIGSWRLEDCTLYVTLEPCPMCSGAILQSRIKKVVFGAMDPKAGAVGSVLNLLSDYPFNHSVEVEAGVLEKECSEILKMFFKELRKK